LKPADASPPAKIDAPAANRRLKRRDSTTRETMQDPQTATAFFLAPVAVAYLTACGLWLACDWRLRLTPSEPALEPSDHPYWDLLLTAAAAAGIFLLGSIYREGWLFPTGTSAAGRIGWLADNVIIYSPIAAVLAIRRQSVRTLFLSPARLAEKVLLGLLLGVIAVSLYSALRGEPGEVPGYLRSALAVDKLVDFLPVFLEGVALAFAFVRLRWVVGKTAAIVIPSLLFAAAHVPGQIDAGRDVAHMATFFAFNTALPAAILWTVARSRDVIWIGLVHYLMDIAIRAI
jgi:Type II CAAX prenyl endopeptidase Rce1-like